jgi:hypothetical protein
MSTSGASGPATSSDRPSSPWPRRIALIVVAAIIVAILIGAIGVGYVLFRPPGPPPVGSETLVIPPEAVSTTVPSP